MLMIIFQASFGRSKWLDSNFRQCPDTRDNTVNKRIVLMNISFADMHISSSGYFLEFAYKSRNFLSEEFIFSFKNSLFLYIPNF